MIVWLCWVYDAITNFAPAATARGAEPRRRRARGWSARWASIPSSRSTAGWPAITRSALLVSDYYDNAHFIVTLGLLGWLWVRRADIYRPLRNVLVLTNVIAFAVFWLYPVAPPRMLRADGFSDVVASTHAFGSWHTGRAGLGRQPAGGDALAAHGLGGVVRGRAVAAVPARVGALRWRSCIRA